MLGQCEVIARVNLKYYEKGRVTSGKDMGEREKEQIVGKLGGFKTSVDLHVSEFLVPDVWGGIIGPGWQDHNAKDKNSPATLSATTRSPDSSTGLSGKLKVLDRAIGGCKRDDPSGRLRRAGVKAPHH